jgi:hypothetical protein
MNAYGNIARNAEGSIMLVNPVQWHHDSYNMPMGRFICPVPLQIISILRGAYIKILIAVAYTNSKSFV